MLLRIMTVESIEILKLNLLDSTQELKNDIQGRILESRNCERERKRVKFHVTVMSFAINSIFL